MQRKKQPRLRWFAMDTDAFLDDDRVQRLTDREQGQWVLLLMKMWRLGARMPDDALFISRAIGLSHKQACEFKAKLEGLKLLVHDGGKDLFSPRLTKEYAITTAAYEGKSAAGKASAKKRKEINGTAQPCKIITLPPNSCSNNE